MLSGWVVHFMLHESPRDPTCADAVELVRQARTNNGAVCVNNLTWWTTDAEVQAACSEFGHVVSLAFSL